MPKVYAPQEHTTDAPCVLVAFSWEEIKNFCVNVQAQHRNQGGYLVESDPSLSAFDSYLRQYTRQIERDTT